MFTRWALSTLGPSPAPKGADVPPPAPQGPGSPASTLSEKQAELANRAPAMLWGVWPRGGGDLGAEALPGPCPEWHI